MAMGEAAGRSRERDESVRAAAMYEFETPDEPQDTPAWVPLRRVFKRAYLSDLARASSEDGPDGGDETFAAAWRSGDRGRFISAMRSIRGQVGAKGQWAIRFAGALLEADLPAEALDTLVRGCGDVGQLTGARALMASLALLRLGAVAEACRGLEACASAPADEVDHQLIAMIRRAIAAGTAQGRPGSWPETTALLEPLLDLQLPELAAGVLAAFLAGEAEPAAEELNPITEYGFTILRSARPQAALQLLAAMAPLFRPARARGPYLDALVELETGQVRTGPPPLKPIRENQGACIAAALAATGHWRAAAKHFHVPLRGAGAFSQVMCELARVIGQDVISSVAPRISRSAEKPKIVDVFPFNGELDVLELKLDAMGSWVDRFVIVEASRTFTGLPKPLVFPGAAERFARHRDKIVYRPIDDFPPYLTSAWAREFYQRDQALHVLADICAADDVVIISDADEIMNLEAVQAFEGIVAGADLRTVCYFLNYERVNQDVNVKPVLARWRVAARTGLSWLRIGVRMHVKSALIPDAGWHLTNIGGAESLVRKYKSISHEEWAHMDKPTFVTFIEQLKAEGLEGYRRLDIDVLPEFIRRRREELAHLMLP
jgi:beta-1,4-mannosyl-glycoprotein beta-1,4-N-acetylglucosaminyltransferase